MFPRPDEHPLQPHHRLCPDAPGLPCLCAAAAQAGTLPWRKGLRVMMEAAHRASIVGGELAISVPIMNRLMERASYEAMNPCRGYGRDARRR